MTPLSYLASLDGCLSSGHFVDVVTAAVFSLAGLFDLAAVAVGGPGRRSGS